MKNKEIEELLNKLKNYPLDDVFALNNAKIDLDLCDLKLLLSCLEQLQERIAYLERSNNRREDTIISLRDELNDSEDCREKAIEYIKEFRFATVKFEQHSDTLLNILKGDSDE